MSDINFQYALSYPVEERVSQSEKLLRPLVVSNCCCLFSCVIRLHPKAHGRCVEILISRMRDVQDLITFSLIDATVHLADFSTTHAGSLHLMESFFKTGRTPSPLLAEKQQ